MPLQGKRDPIVRNRDPELDYELIGVLGEGSYGVVWKAKVTAAPTCVTNAVGVRKGPRHGRAGGH